MPIISFDIDTGVAPRKVRVVEQRGFIVDAISIPIVPPGTGVVIELGGGQRIAVDGPGYIDGLEPQYKEDSREGVSIEYDTQVVGGTIRGFASVRSEGDNHGGIKAAT